MTQQPKRCRLKSLSDLQRQQAIIYRECRSGMLEDGKMQALSQVLKRLHDMKIQEKEIDISEQLLELEEQLAELQLK